MKGRVLIAGFATRHVAQSAFRAGYEVCAVDHFCDQDLSWWTKDRIRFEDLADLPDAIAEMAKRHRCDIFVPTSGAETLQAPIPLCGTPASTIGQYLDKLDTQHFFRQICVPAPCLVDENTFPAMIKPLRGAGGWRNKVVRSREDLDRWIAQFEGMPFLLQEVVDGFPASVCCIADGNRAVGIAANEQILRGDDVAPYGFCGSLTPLEHQVKEKMIACAEQIAAASGCTGCIGIDFVISGNTPYAIEINPRFQGTLDTVELSTGCNLFDLHVQACRGIIPRERPEATQAAARSILFADRDITVREDLSRFSGFATDIPWPGTFFEGGQAVMSVTGTGRDPTSARSALDTNISTIRQYIR